MWFKVESFFIEDTLELSNLENLVMKRIKHRFSVFDHHFNSGISHF